MEWFPSHHQIGHHILEYGPILPRLPSTWQAVVPLWWCGKPYFTNCRASRNTVQLKLQCFDGSKPINILSFLLALETEFDSNEIHKVAAFWLLNFFLYKESSCSRHYHTHLSVCVNQLLQDCKFTLYSKVVNYLQMKDEKTTNIAEADMDIRNCQEACKAEGGVIRLGPVDESPTMWTGLPRVSLGSNCYGRIEKVHLKVHLQILAKYEVASLQELAWRTHTVSPWFTIGLRHTAVRSNYEAVAKKFWKPTCSQYLYFWVCFKLWLLCRLHKQWNALSATIRDHVKETGRSIWPIIDMHDINQKYKSGELL